MEIDVLHEKGYTFNGPAPISGLTYGERRLLMLGHLVRGEQQQPDEHGTPGRGSGRRRKYSKPRRTTEQAMRDFEEKHNLGNNE